MTIESMLERSNCISFPLSELKLNKIFSRNVALIFGKFLTNSVPQGKIQSLRFSDALKLNWKQAIHKRMHL